MNRKRKEKTKKKTGDQNRITKPPKLAQPDK
jgi:hypothetical protein